MEERTAYDPAAARQQLAREAALAALSDNDNDAPESAPVSASTPNRPEPTTAPPPAGGHTGATTPPTEVVAGSTRDFRFDDDAEFGVRLTPHSRRPAPPNRTPAPPAPKPSVTEAPAAEQAETPAPPQATPAPAKPAPAVPPLPQPPAAKPEPALDQPTHRADPSAPTVGGRVGEPAAPREFAASLAVGTRESSEPVAPPGAAPSLQAPLGVPGPHWPGSAQGYQPPAPPAPSAAAAAADSADSELAGAPHYAAPAASTALPGPAPVLPEMSIIDTPDHELPEMEVVPANVTPATTAWRAMARRMGFAVKESDDERKWRRFVKKMNLPLNGPIVVGYTALKGGGAKTTTTIAAGVSIARLRAGARVCAVDTDPLGDLILRSDGMAGSSILDFAAAIANGNERRPAYMAHTVDGVDILGAAPSLLDQPLTPDGWQAVLDELKERYDVILVDMAVIKRDPTYQAVLRSLDSLVITAPPTVAGTRMLDQIPQWLDQEGASHLKSRRMVVISKTDTLDNEIDVDELRRVLRSGGVHAAEVPFDAHLRAAEDTSYDDLDPKTRKAYVVIGATVVEISS